MLLISIMMASILSGNPSGDLPTVKQVDLQRYSGLWYEIARLPNSFEKDLECVTARYTILKNGKIEVLNRGFSTKKGDFKNSKGKATQPDNNFPGRLKVTFFWPFSGDYYIIALDKDYSWALVGSPTRDYLWVLSRTKQLDDSIYADLVAKAGELGFDTGQLHKVKHNCK